MWTFIQSITLQDSIDILLNSYILFRFYILFRGTNAIRAIFGIALLWCFQIFSVYMGLIITSWVMQGVMAIAALIIIIVFRNEIRLVLQTKSLKSILWGISKKDSDTPVEVIVASVYELSKQKTGALIVIPGNKDSESLIQNGIPWRGIVSKEMILSIFWRNNPVHDGAIIIRGNRIMKVSAILPLTMNDDLPSYYGTRHRAALGLAEHSDAMVIVVSEETGKVSVAQGVKIVETSDNVDLAKMLHTHLGTTSKEPRFLMKERIQIWLAAILSFAIITTIWYSFTKGQDTLFNIKIPVEYMNKQPGIEILDTSANLVNLELGGSGAIMRKIKPEQVKVSLDLGNAVQGRNIFTITKDNISLPPGIELNRVKPQTIDVTLDILVIKELPVQVDLAGKLPDNIIIEEIFLNPKTVTVTGGSRILKNISTIYTEKVSLYKIVKSHTIDVSLALNPASLKVNSEKISVSFLVKERIN